MFPVWLISVTFSLLLVLHGIASAVNSTAEPSSLPSTVVIITVSTFPPTLVPTVLPSVTPTEFPSSPPANFTSLSPTFSPSVAPSVNSTSGPPTETPTIASLNTSSPSIAPSVPPTVRPTVEPTSLPPSVAPSVSPTQSPSQFPSLTPSVAPSVSPTFNPTLSMAPTVSSLCQVDHVEWINNGICNDEGNYNTAPCGYDGGDCCLSTRNKLSLTLSIGNNETAVVHCRDPLIMRNASVSFMLANVTMSTLGLNETELLTDLIVRTFTDLLMLSESEVAVTANLDIVNSLVQVNTAIAFEGPLARNSSVMANLSSIAVEEALLMMVHSGQLEDTLRQVARSLDLNKFAWTIVCSNIEACNALLHPTANEDPDSACSYTEGDWRNFYGWSDSEWSADNFPKYFLWLLFQFFLVVWFALCISLCYYQERFFLSRSRRLQYSLSIVTGVLILLYLVLEIFIPGMYSEPETFSCIEFSFRDNASGLEYNKATVSDYYYWNPYISTVFMMVNALVSWSVICPVHSLCGLWLRGFHYGKQLSVALTLMFIPFPAIQLVLYAIQPSIGMYTAIPLHSLCAVWQIVCGVQILISVAHSHLEQAVWELRSTFHTASVPIEVKNANERDAVSTTPCVGITEHESQSAEASNSNSSANSSSSSGLCNDEERKEEHVLSIDRPVTRVPFKDSESSTAKLVRVLLGVLWIVTAVVDLKNNPLLGLVLYSVILRICLFVVVFQLSYSTEAQLPQ